LKEGEINTFGGEMNKSELIQVLEDLNLDREKIQIAMGSAMVMHGIKESTKDADCQCDHDYFKLLLAMGHQKSIARSGCDRIDLGLVELFDTPALEESIRIEGWKVDTLEDIVKEKKKYGREKDLRDIKLIEEYL
jgi:hypothetical protein